MMLAVAKPPAGRADEEEDEDDDEDEEMLFEVRPFIGKYCSVVVGATTTILRVETTRER